MRSLYIPAALVLLVFACANACAADTYSCEIRERLLLNDDGLVRATPSLGVSSPQFMIDKKTGNAVGEVFGPSTWQIAQQGSPSMSLVSQGSVATVFGPSIAYKIIVYSFNKAREKSFVIEDRAAAGLFGIYTAGFVDSLD